MKPTLVLCTLKATVQNNGVGLSCLLACDRPVNIPISPFHGNSKDLKQVRKTIIQLSTT